MRRHPHRETFISQWNSNTSRRHATVISSPSAKPDHRAIDIGIFGCQFCATVLLPPPSNRSQLYLVTIECRDFHSTLLRSTSCCKLINCFPNSFFQKEVGFYGIKEKKRYVHFTYGIVTTRNVQIQSIMSSYRSTCQLFV